MPARTLSCALWRPASSPTNTHMCGFSRTGCAPASPTQVSRRRALAFALWLLTAIGATFVVAFDHGPLLDAIGHRRTRFISDVLADFAKVVAGVQRPSLGLV